MIDRHIQALLKKGACYEAIQFLRDGHFASVLEAWCGCQHIEWMLFVINVAFPCQHDPHYGGIESKRAALLYATTNRICAAFVPKEEIAAFMYLIDMQERYGLGENISLEEIRKAEHDANRFSVVRKGVPGFFISKDASLLCIQEIRKSYPDPTKEIEAWLFPVAGDIGS